MTITQVGAFTGQMPDTENPATFDARANTIWAWLVTSLVFDFNLSVGQVNDALTEIQEILAGSDTLLSRFDDLGDLAQLNRNDLAQTLAVWKEGIDGSTRLVSPTILKQVFDQHSASQRIGPDWTEFLHNQTVTFDHALGEIPREVSIEYQAKYAEHDFGVGEVIQGAFMVEGDRDVRATLYAAANALLMRTMAGSQIKPWGMRLMRTKGRRRAVVAFVGPARPRRPDQSFSPRKLAVLLHRMWVDGTEFRQDPVGGKT